MKKSIFAILTLAVAALFCSCNSAETYAPEIQGATNLATTSYLISLGSKANTVAPYVSQISTAIYSLAGGTPPTPAELQSTIAKFTSNPIAQSLGVDLGAIVVGQYSTYYDKLSGNAKEAAIVLEAAAAGVTSGAAPFITK